MGSCSHCGLTEQGPWVLNHSSTKWLHHWASHVHQYQCWPEVRRILNELKNRQIVFISYVLRSNYNFSLSTCCKFILRHCSWMALWRSIGRVNLMLGQMIQSGARRLHQRPVQLCSCALVDFSICVRISIPITQPALNCRGTNISGISYQSVIFWNLCVCFPGPLPFGWDHYN